jgi:hypothetical protein
MDILPIIMMLGAILIVLIKIKITAVLILKKLTEKK